MMMRAVTDQGPGARTRAPYAAGVAVLLAAVALFAVLALLRGESPVPGGPLPAAGGPRTTPAATMRGAGASEAAPREAAPAGARTGLPAIAVDAEGRPLAGGRRDLDSPVTGPGAILLFEDRAGRKVAGYPTTAGEFLCPVEFGESPVSLSAFLPGAVGSFLAGPEDVDPSTIAGGRTFTFRRAAAGAVRIVCHDDADRRLGAKVRIERAAAGDVFTVGNFEVDPATGEGLLRIEGPGSYRAVVLEVSSRAVRSLEGRREEFEIRAGETTTLPLAFAAECSLDVRVVGARGEPVPGVLVGLHFRDAGTVRVSSKSGKSDADGRFRFAGLEPGTVTVIATGQDREPAAETLSLVRGEARELVLRSLPGGAALRGRLRGLDPEGLRRLDLFAVRAGVAPEQRHAVWSAELDREDGAFRLSGLARGRYELSIHSADVKITARVDVVDGEMDLGDMDLSPLLVKGPGTVSLRVVSGDPLLSTATVRVFFVVLLRNEEWPAGLWWQRAAYPERTSIRGLPAGRWRAVFGAPVNDESRYDLGAEVEFSIPGQGGAVEVDLPAPPR